MPRRPICSDQNLASGPAVNFLFHRATSTHELKGMRLAANSLTERVSRMRNFLATSGLASSAVSMSSSARGYTLASGCAGNNTRRLHKRVDDMARLLSVCGTWQFADGQTLEPV